MSQIIAITGGIGSGKSTVCRILTILGLKVYDCDSRAKLLMESDPEILDRIAREVDADAVNKEGDTRIDRRHLASVVFANPDKLLKLNSIVHGAVHADIDRWVARNASEPVLFVETAILLESNLDKKVHAVWKVDAPEKVRVARASLRDNASPKAIAARMKAQRDIAAEDLDIPLEIIVNDGVRPVLPRVFQLLESCGVTPAAFHDEWEPQSAQA